MWTAVAATPATASAPATTFGTRSRTMRVTGSMFFAATAVRSPIRCAMPWRNPIASVFAPTAASRPTSCSARLPTSSTKNAAPFSITLSVNGSATSIVTYQAISAWPVGLVQNAFARSPASPG